MSDICLGISFSSPFLCSQVHFSNSVITANLQLWDDLSKHDSLHIYIYIDVPWVVRTVQYCTFLKIHIVITEYTW